METFVLGFASGAIAAFLALSIIGALAARMYERNLHRCTDCGELSDNTRSTSLCRDCQIKLLMSLAEQNWKEE